MVSSILDQENENEESKFQMKFNQSFKKLTILNDKRKERN